MENSTYMNTSWADYGFEIIDKTPFVVIFGIFLALALVLNIAAIACVITVYVKRPATKRGLPKLGVILVICVLHVAYFAGPSALVLHWHKTYWIDKSILILSCQGFVALELSFFVMPCLVKLLVASMALLEALRLQTIFIASCKVQVVTAVGLALASVIYVLVVIVPVFFMTWLEDNTQPCYADMGILHIAANIDRRRLIHVCDFILPVIFIFLACLVLLLAYLTRKKNTSAVRYMVFSPHSLGDTESAAEEMIGLDQSDPQCHSAAEEMVGLNQLGPQSFSAAVTLPVNVLVAGVLLVVFNFVFFFYSFVDFNKFDIPYDEGQKVWEAGRILAVLGGVFLPVCWILDAEIRSLCCHRSPSLSN